jgi:multiple sugar transport system permease protein
VALMILWMKLLNPEFGPINLAVGSIFRALHIHAELPTWLKSAQNLFALRPQQLGFDARVFGVGAREGLILMAVWLAIGGNNMLLYLAALSNVPPELYEAAEIDGAGRWARFWNVTSPQLAPTTFFIVVISVIGGLQSGFEQAQVMTNGGGPAGTTTTLAYYIYLKAFKEFQMGYASAVAWVLFAVIFIVTLLNWQFGSRAINE